MKRERVLSCAAAILVLSLRLFGQCGTERWPVKIGTDADSKLVNPADFTATTIASLIALPAPVSLPQNNRIQPTETTVFVLNATLTEFKLESDSDYHLVLSDAAGKTMIAEIPSPGCVSSSSPFSAAIASARTEFNARFTALTNFTKISIPVQVKGVGFFDFLHGQTGVAPNAIELHPVLDILFNPVTPTITSVNTAGGYPDIAQNTWIEIKGANLSPSSVGPGGMTWSGTPEFASGRMPTALNGVSVKVNGKPAYVYYISGSQINVLTPLDNFLGVATVAVTNGANTSAPFATNLRAVAPSFIPVGATKYAIATHADGSLIGPESLSAPGYSFTPAQPGEIVVLYGFGFGLPTTSLTDGSAMQSGALPALPEVRIGGVPATVLYAGVISPGLYQFNVVVPVTSPSGDLALAASFGGASTPAAVLTVQ